MGHRTPERTIPITRLSTLDRSRNTERQGKIKSKNLGEIHQKLNENPPVSIVDAEETVTNAFRINMAEFICCR